MENYPFYPSYLVHCGKESTNENGPEIEYLKAVCSFSIKYYGSLELSWPGCPDICFFDDYRES